MGYDEKADFKSIRKTVMHTSVSGVKKNGRMLFCK